jgi:hypothetical protein
VPSAWRGGRGRHATEGLWAHASIISGRPPWPKSERGVLTAHHPLAPGRRGA